MVALKLNLVRNRFTKIGDFLLAYYKKSVIKHNNFLNVGESQLILHIKIVSFYLRILL